MTKADIINEVSKSTGFTKVEVENQLDCILNTIKVSLTKGKRVDIRGFGMMGGIDIRLDEKPGKAGYSVFKKLFEAGLSLKATGDCLIVAPPFIAEKSHIDEIVEKLRTGITNYQKNH